MGHPLSQSLFTSAYIDRLLWPDPKTLEQARFERDKTPGPGNELLHLVLRAYCLGLIKTCDFVRRSIMSEQYYEVSPLLSMDFRVRSVSRQLCVGRRLCGEPVPSKTARRFRIGRYLYGTGRCHGICGEKDRFDGPSLQRGPPQSARTSQNVAFCCPTRWISGPSKSEAMGGVPRANPYAFADE